MKMNYATELQEMSMQEMREVNGGCCLIKFLLKFLCCCKPKCGGGNNGGGTDPGQPED